MLTALREIGRWQRNQKQTDELGTLIKEPFNNGKIIFIKVDVDENRYCGVEIEDYIKQKLHRYLYRRLSSQGPNCSPAALITSPEKTYRGKILKFFEDHSQAADILEKIRGLLEANTDKIIKEIAEITERYGQKERYLLTLKIRHNREWNYIGDLTIFRIYSGKVQRQKLKRRLPATESAVSAVRRKMSAVTPGFSNFIRLINQDS